MDGRFFCELCTSLPDIGGSGVVPFHFNNPQTKFFNDFWLPRVDPLVIGKSRKFGLSAEIIYLGTHEAMYTEACDFAVFTHSDKTSVELNRHITGCYESAWQFFKTLGEDPRYYLPRKTNDNAFGLVFGEQRSSVSTQTSGGAGVGQSSKYDIAYLTEYSEWTDVKQITSQIAGSQPPGSKRNRRIVDFNAKGVTNEAYSLYQNAKLDHSDPNWNGYYPVFYGILDAPEVYTEQFIERMRRELPTTFKQVYPANDVEMFLVSDKAVFDFEQLVAAHDKGKAMGFQPDSKHRIHIVDTASGNPGGDFQVCTSWGLVDDVWIQSSPSIRGHWPEDVFAIMVADRCHDDPGLCLVERNVGSAVLVKLREEGVENLYRHRHRDKTGKQYMQLGFPMTFSTKRTGISGAQRLLREGELAIVEPEMFTEMREYEWKVKETPGQDEQTQVAGAPDREGAHDDLAITCVMLPQAIEVVGVVSGQLFSVRG